MPEDLLSPVEPVKMSTRIAERLAELVYRREFPPGSRLPPENVLAARLGASRATVREALSALKALGLLESRAGQGTFVRVDAPHVWDWKAIVQDIRSREAFLDALEAREAIESEVCRLAAERASKLDLARIASALRLSQEATTEEEFREADRAFHLALARASRNRLLCRFIEQAFETLTGPYWASLARAGQAAQEVFARYSADHAAIYEAVAARDSSLAKRRMMQHIANVREDFLGHQQTAARGISAEGHRRIRVAEDDREGVSM